MGIKIRALVRPASRKMNLAELFQRALAIDASNTLYQFLSTVRRRDGTPLKDEEGNITSHLAGALYRTLRLIEAGIDPIYVFDGESPRLKREESRRRRERRELSRRRWEEARGSGDLEEARKHAARSSRVTDGMVDEAKELLRAMGVPCVQAPSEAESQAALLVERGDAWACATQDYDALLFGSARVVRNLGGTGHPELIRMEALLGEWGLTRAQLVDMAVLIGTDFYDGITGVGQKTALHLVEEYGDLESAIEAGSLAPRARDRLLDDWHRVERVRSIFLEPEVDCDYELPLRSDPDCAKVEELLVEDKGFSPDRVKSAVSRLREDIAEARQSTLDGYFS
jgi:flap endonuclease-1